MSTKNTKRIEYKETKVFDLFPDFNYSRRQRQRVILFHAYAKNVRKIINYAIHFDAPNKICLVYIVGEPNPDLVMKTLEASGCSDRICVLTAPFTKENHSLCDAFYELRDKLIHRNEYDPESVNYTQEKLDRIDNAKREYEAGTLSSIESEYYLTCVHEKDIIDRFRELYQRRMDIFGKFTLYRANHDPVSYSPNDLDSLIEQVFPKGTEALGVNDLSSVSPALAERGINHVINGQDDKRLGYVVDDHTPLVKEIKRFINKEFEAKGYCSLKDLANDLINPPFGTFLCAYTASCLTYALKSYANRTMLFTDSIRTYHTNDEIETILFWMLADNKSLSARNREERTFLYIESRPHKIVKKMIHEVFNVPMKVPSINMIAEARSRLQKKYRYPMSAVDDRLYQLLDIGWRWYDRDEVNKLADQISGKEYELQDRFFRYRMIDLKLKGKERLNYPECASWLWKTDETKEVFRANIALKTRDKGGAVS